jgi:transcriptional regulator with XRE-family HTH domain
MPRSVDPEVLRAFGTALRDCRKTAGLSQEGLLREASRAGLEAPNRSYISSLETGRQEPGLGMQFRLARAIGIRPSEILRKAEEMVLPRSERRRIDRIAAGRIPLGTETCPGCRTVYSMYVERLKSRQRGKFKCSRCKQPLASWLGTTRFIFETLRLPKARQAK